MKVRMRDSKGRVPKGDMSSGNKTPRVTIQFDDDMFKLLQNQSKTTGASFNKTVRQFLRLGMGLK
jgi:hypothetical protein